MHAVINKGMELPYDNKISGFKNIKEQLTAKERWVYGYICAHAGRYISPSEIGRDYLRWKVGDNLSTTSYYAAIVVKQCRSLSQNGWVERSTDGRYRIIAKYPSIENDCDEKYIDRAVSEIPDLQEETYELQEKIHGSNFRILIENDYVAYYGRRFLADEQYFNARQAIKRNTELLKSFLQEFGYLLNASQVIFCGELYGSHIQKKIKYTNEHGFKVFDVIADGEHLPPVHPFVQKLKAEGYFVPVVTSGLSLKEAFEYNITVPTKVGDLNVNKGNIIEGVVIKPENKIYKQNNGKIFYLKRKNPKFSEKNKSNVNMKNLSKLDKIKNEFACYLTENRVDAVMSKQSYNNAGEVLRDIIEDAKHEFLKNTDYDLHSFSKRELKKIFKPTNKIITYVHICV